MATKREPRTRTWLILVYPDSAPKNWISILRELCIPAFISPLHDKDVDENGELKKPHWHVILMFSNVQPESKVQEISDMFSGVKPVKCGDTKAQARYLCHMDDPEKFQYDPKDVVQLGGADYSKMVLTNSDKQQAFREMRKFVKENDIIAYCDLFDYAADNNDSWFQALCGYGSSVMKDYIKSRTWKAREERLKELESMGVIRK